MEGQIKVKHKGYYNLQCIHVPFQTRTQTGTNILYVLAHSEVKYEISRFNRPKKRQSVKFDYDCNQLNFSVSRTSRT